MILSILATVAVLAAIVVIAAALLLAETVLVYIALGLGAVSVLLLLGALVQGRVSEDRTTRERSGTDGLGKSSVPTAVAPSQEAVAPIPRAHMEPEDVGRVPASVPEPMRETIASNTSTEDPWSEESEFEVPRWQTPTRGGWPEPVTESTDPLPEPEPSNSAFTEEETPFAYSIPRATPSEDVRDDLHTVESSALRTPPEPDEATTDLEEAVTSQNAVGEGPHGETGLTDVSVSEEEPPDEDAGTGDSGADSGSGAGSDSDMDEEAFPDQDAGTVDDDEVSEGSEAAVNDAVVDGDEVLAKNEELDVTAEAVADTEDLDVESLEEEGDVPPEGKEISETAGTAGDGVDLDGDTETEEPVEEDTGTGDDDEDAVPSEEPQEVEEDLDEESGLVDVSGDTMDVDSVGGAPPEEDGVSEDADAAEDVDVSEDTGTVEDDEDAVASEGEVSPDGDADAEVPTERVAVEDVDAAEDTQVPEDTESDTPEESAVACAALLDGEQATGDLDEADVPDTGRENPVS